MLLTLALTRKLGDSQHLAILCDDLLLLEVLLLLVHHGRRFLCTLLLIVVSCVHVGAVLGTSGACRHGHGMLIVVLQLLLDVMVLHRATWHVHHLLPVLADSILKTAGTSIIVPSLANCSHHMLLLLLLLLPLLLLLLNRRLDLLLCRRRCCFLCAKLRRHLLLVLLLLLLILLLLFVTCLLLHHLHVLNVFSNVHVPEAEAGDRHYRA